MKIVTLLILLCTLAEGATAETTECQSIPKSSARLACYDKAAPSTTAPDKSATSKPSVPQGQPVDRLSAENARLDAAINNICRGC